MVNFLTLLPHYLLLLLEITLTLFILIIISKLIWEWLTKSTIEDKRVVKNV